MDELVVSATAPLRSVEDRRRCLPIVAHMLAAGEQEYGEADSDQCADDDAQLSVPCPVFSHHSTDGDRTHRANACAGWRFLPCTQRVGMCARYCADDGALPQHRQHRSGARRLLRETKSAGAEGAIVACGLVPHRNMRRGSCDPPATLSRQRNIYIYGWCRAEQPDRAIDTIACAIFLAGLQIFQLHHAVGILDFRNCGALQGDILPVAIGARNAIMKI